MKTIEELGLRKCEYNPKWDQEAWFYKDKNGNIMPYLKEDIQKIIDPLKPSTFLPILKLFDIPYIEDEWIKTICSISENVFRWHNRTVFGSYLSKMKLAAYKPFGFKDSTMQYENIEDLDNIEYYIQSSVLQRSIDNNT